MIHNPSTLDWSTVAPTSVIFKAPAEQTVATTTTSTLLFWSFLCCFCSCCCRVRLFRPSLRCRSVLLSIVMPFTALSSP
ncbi:hypothetical protein S245_002448 [Arachis hypogaea]